MTVNVLKGDGRRFGGRRSTFRMAGMEFHTKCTVGKNRERVCFYCCGIGNSLRTFTAGAVFSSSGLGDRAGRSGGGWGGGGGGDTPNTFSQSAFRASSANEAPKVLQQRLV